MRWFGFPLGSAISLLQGKGPIQCLLAITPKSLEKTN